MPDTQTYIPGFQDALRYTNTSALGLAPGSVDMNEDQQRNFMSSIQNGSMSAAKPVGVISSDQGKTIVDGAMQDHTADMSRIAGAQNTGTQNTTTATDPSKPKGLTYDEAKNLGVDLNSAVFDPATNTYTPSSTDSSYNPQTKSIIDSSQKDIAEANDAFKNMSGMLDASGQSIINQISSIYQARMKDQIEANRRNQAQYETAGIRTGGARYAQAVNAGILSAEERVGIDKLNKLAADMAQGITKAQDAVNNKKYSLFVAERNNVAKIKSNMTALLGKLQTSALKENDKAKAAQIQSTRDGTISGIISQGITDPNEILNHLNFDASGKQTGNFTAKEVGAAIKNLTGGSDLTGSLKEFYAVKDRGLLPENIKNLPTNAQYFAYLNAKKTAEHIESSRNPAAGRTPPASVVAQGLTDFHDPRVFGSDKKVDPIYYKQKYDAWTNDGYSRKSFLEHFPPDQYVNPDDNHFLPKYLQTTVKGSSSATYPKPTADTISVVVKARKAGESEPKIRQDIIDAGYNPDDPVFKGPIK